MSYYIRITQLKWIWSKREYGWGTRKCDISQKEKYIKEWSDGRKEKLQYGKMFSPQNEKEKERHEENVTQTGNTQNIYERVLLKSFP